MRVCCYVNAHHMVIAPTAPRNLKNYIDSTHTDVLLTWRRPDPPNGLITHYNVSDITNS